MCMERQSAFFRKRKTYGGGAVIAPTASGLKITLVISVLSKCLTIPVTGFLHSGCADKAF